MKAVVEDEATPTDPGELHTYQHLIIEHRNYVAWAKIFIASMYGYDGIEHDGGNSCVHY